MSLSYAIVALYLQPSHIGKSIGGSRGHFHIWVRACGWWCLCLTHMKGMVTSCLRKLLGSAFPSLGFVLGLTPYITMHMMKARMIYGYLDDGPFWQTLFFARKVWLIILYWENENAQNTSVAKRPGRKCLERGTTQKSDKNQIQASHGGRRWWYANISLKLWGGRRGPPVPRPEGTSSSAFDRYASHPGCGPFAP